jgi:hypothetical protein
MASLGITDPDVELLDVVLRVTGEVTEHAGRSMANCKRYTVTAPTINRRCTACWKGAAPVPSYRLAGTRRRARGRMAPGTATRRSAGSSVTDTKPGKSRAAITAAASRKQQSAGSKAPSANDSGIPSHPTNKRNSLSAANSSTGSSFSECQSRCGFRKQDTTGH